VLARLDGQAWLMASLLYGAGLRLMECVRLRVKDVGFGYRQILVREGKGQKDRVTMLPHMVMEPLRAQLQKVKTLHEQDLGRDLERFTCHLHWNTNILMLAANGVGSMSCRPRSGPRIRVRARNAAITSMRRCCSGQSKRQFVRPGSRSREAVTPFDIVSLPSCSQQAMISAPCRSCWATRMCVPR
jgi:integrase